MQSALSTDRSVNTLIRLARPVTGEQTTDDEVASLLQAGARSEGALRA
jgi:hypothetical protein